MNRLSEASGKNKFAGEEVKKEEWIPKEGELLWCIDSAGNVGSNYRELASMYQKWISDYTGIFQTKEEAEARRDAIKQFCENL